MDERNYESHTLMIDGITTFFVHATFGHHAACFSSSTFRRYNAAIGLHKVRRHSLSVKTMSASVSLCFSCSKPRSHMARMW